MERHYFTLDEANRRLSEVERSLLLMREALEGGQQVRDQIQVLEVIGALDPRSPEHEELLERRAELEDWRAAFMDEQARLERDGIIVRDLVAGLVDFPALWQGREIHLCWRLGEAQVSWWHEVDAGFTGRRPASELGEQSKAEGGSAG